MGPKAARYFAIAALVVAVLVDVGAQRTRTVVDLTAGQSLSLTEQSVRLVEAVDATTTITAFLGPDDPERAAASALLLRYQRVNSRIRFRLLDPRGAPGEMRRLGIDPELGGVAVVRGEQIEVVPTITEQDLTGALARLARGRSAEVCMTVGHGESATTDRGAIGLFQAGRLLLENGYQLRDVDLLANAEIPSTCDAVVIAGPTAPLGDAADVVRRWLTERDGRLLLLADPVAPEDDGLRALLGDFGLGIRRGIVLEGESRLVARGDPAAPIVSSYTSANPIVRRLAPTFFPGVQQVVASDGDAAEGLTVARLATTSPLAYLETEPLTSAFDPAADVPGPIVVAAAGDRVRLSGSSVRRSRVVVVGDVDFATNNGLGQAANGELLVRSLDWLSLDDQLVVLSANLPEHRPLVLTSGRLRYARFVSLAVLPGLFLLVGALVWLLRRGS